MVNPMEFKYRRHLLVSKFPAADHYSIVSLAPAGLALGASSRVKPEGVGSSSPGYSDIGNIGYDY